MSCILITGGTGMIGQALTSELIRAGHQVIILSRKAGRSGNSNLRYAEWDIEKGKMDEEALVAADYIVHLAGANVAEKRWTEKRKKEIISSRTLSGKLLIHTLGKVPNKVKALISSSAIGYYGPDPVVPNPHPFREEDGPYHDYLSDVVQQWESAIHPVVRSNKRLVIFRTGIVLSREGGAYREFLKPVKFHLATIFGSGSQIVSWIHIKDLVSLYIKAITDESLSGVYNAVAPFPVDNRTLITTIAREHGNYLPVSVPSSFLKILLGEMSIEILKSATVSAEKIQKAGFIFQFDEIQKAVRDLKTN